MILLASSVLRAVKPVGCGSGALSKDEQHVKDVLLFSSYRDAHTKWWQRWSDTGCVSAAFVAI